MSSLDKEFLWELIDSADVAIRTTCELRSFLQGDALSDPDVLRKAQFFLGSAKRGGTFISGKDTLVGFEGTLRPLNWATDVYLLASSSFEHEQSGGSPDYSMIAHDLGEIEQTLVQLLAGQPPSNEQIEKALSFFEILGDLLGSQADQDILREFTASLA